jgi:RNA polymerase sigma-70 factor (ECF subfamily)
VATLNRQPDSERPLTASRTSIVRELPTKRTSDEELVGELRAGSPNAATMLFDRYAVYVERLLWNVLGPEPDAEDLLQEVFLRAIVGIQGIDDPGRLRSWLTGIAVNTAREWIRRRSSRRRFLHFFAEVPEPPPVAPNEELTEATRCTFEVLSSMREDDRVMFSLRFIEGLELTEIALACDVSLSTAKRRLKSAEVHFLARAKRHEALLSWIAEGGRWKVPC